MYLLILYIVCNELSCALFIYLVARLIYYGHIVSLPGKILGCRSYSIKNSVSYNIKLRTRTHDPILSTGSMSFPNWSKHICYKTQ